MLLSEEKKMAKLHELLAVEADLSNTAKAMLEEAATTFQKKPDHFLGQVRSVKFMDATREQENVVEEKAMVTTVDDKLTYALGRNAKYWDAMLQKEAANSEAKADLVIDGETVMKDLPATFLLGMETRLRNVQQVLLTIPTLDPSIKWSEDQSAGDAVFKSDVQVGFKTEKVMKSKTLYDATKEHPAQIGTWNEDVPVARVETIKTSGMWTPRRKADVLARLDTLIRAVKKARQRANAVDVTDLHVGKKLIDYLLAD
jgi:hypothetical protein